MTQTNKDVQYIMPPEWAPQEATWLSFPINRDTWSLNLKQARHEFSLLVHAIAMDQTAYVMCGGHIETAQALIVDQYIGRLSQQQIDNIRFIDIPTNDAWARDYAPTFVRSVDSNDQIVAIDWHYNAWGEKYPPFDLDQDVSSRVASYLGIENVAAGICGEGGALEINGEGLLLVTQSSIVNANRNPTVDQKTIQQVLQRCLGTQHVIWLPGDIDGATILGDDTDGHIDQLVRFTDDRTLVYAWTDDENDPQRHGLAENLDQLKRQLHSLNLDAPFNLIGLPLPKAIEHCGLRLPASYCNFVVTNASVLVPQFGNDRSDARALEILGPLFPGRRLVPLPSRELTVGLGSFHCLTQHQPTGNVQTAATQS